MLKKLLLTTAMVAVTGVAYAAQSTTTTAPKANVTAAATVNGRMFVPVATTGDHLASKLIGAEVYNRNAQDAEAIGKVNDLILADNGSVKAVVVGVGGFLGIGEKNVAIDFASLQWSTRDDGPVLIAPTTKDELHSAPAFDLSSLEKVNANGNPQPRNQMAVNPPAENLQVVDVTTVSAKELINTTVYSGNNENIGEVGDVILAKDGKIDAVVLDVGGFLGVGEKPVAMAFDALNIRKDADGKLYLYTPFSKAQLDQAPAYDKNRYMTDRDAMRLSVRT